MKRIISIKTIAHKYDYFLFDQWGVLHNGYKVFEDAIDCLQELKNLNKKNILKVGVGYSFQKIDKIPTNKFDKKLDIIITEKYILR